jgi:hypothetical protein
MYVAHMLTHPDRQVPRGLFEQAIYQHHGCERYSSRLVHFNLSEYSGRNQGAIDQGQRSNVQ